MSLFSVLRDPIRLPQVGWIGSKRWANRVSRNVDISHESNTFPQINVFLPTAPTHLSWYHSFPLPWQWIQSPRLADLGSLCFTLQSSHEVSFPSSSYVSDDSDDDVDGFTSHLLVTCLLTFCWGNSFLLLFSFSAVSRIFSGRTAVCFLLVHLGVVLFGYGNSSLNETAGFRNSFWLRWSLRFWIWLETRRQKLLFSHCVFVEWINASWTKSIFYNRRCLKKL